MSLYTKERGIFTNTTKTKGSQRTLKLPTSVFKLLRRLPGGTGTGALTLG